MHTKQTLLLALLAAVLFCQWLAMSPARAHPLSQGFVEIVLYRDKAVLRARTALEEVVVANQWKVGANDSFSLPRQTFDIHAQYLLKHIRILTDDKPLAGKVIRVDPGSEAASISPLNLQKAHVVYEFEFPLDPAALPRQLKIEQDVLNEVLYAPGNPWEATYVMRIGHFDSEMQEGLLLTNSQPVLFTCQWAAPTPALPPLQPPVAKVNLGSSALAYLKHGIGHIIGHPTERGWDNVGYDHLLFIAALVLGALSFWDLFKVVTAFTLAHTLTLTLSALDIVRLPERIVEPMIAASIVFVAVENVLWPQRSRGWGRLGAAFFFGLFHGLGFAGGLLDAMQTMQTSTVLLAIAAFSLGVEIGHQAVVLPLFGALKLIRKSRGDEPAREKFSRLALQYGSAVISVAGVFYLVTALNWFA